MNTRTLLFLSTLVLFGGPAEAALSARNKCSAVKGKATAKAFACVAEAENDAIRGVGSGDVAACLDKLSASFSRVESAGACAIAGDASAAAAVIDDAEADVLATLGAGSLAEEEKACVMRLNRAVAKFVVCRAGRWASTLAGGEAPQGDPASPCCPDSCGLAFQRRFYSLLGKGDPCPALSFSYELLDLVAAVQAYLPGADFAGLDLRGVELTGAILHDANFANAELDDSSLDGADLAAAQMESCRLAGVHAVGLQACPASLPPDWSCTNDNLVGPLAHLDGANLDGANLSGRNLQGIGLNGVSLSGADLSGANLSNSSFQNAALANANLASADLTGANLSFANLDPADLTGANLTDAILRGADLSGSTLQSANLTNAEVWEADLDPVASWLMTICPDATMSAANGGTCCGHHVGGAPTSCAP